MTSGDDGTWRKAHKSEMWNQEWVDGWNNKIDGTRPRGLKRKSEGEGREDGGNFVRRKSEAPESRRPGAWLQQMEGWGKEGR